MKCHENPLVESRPNNANRRTDKMLIIGFRQWPRVKINLSFSVALEVKVYAIRSTVKQKGSEHRAGVVNDVSNLPYPPYYFWRDIPHRDVMRSTNDPSHEIFNIAVWLCNLSGRCVPASDQ
jgi:hypothetical protein